MRRVGHREEQEQRPPETALKRQSRGIGEDEGARSIAFIFEEANLDMSLSNFKRRVKRKKREMGGMADDYAAAQLVAEDHNGFR